MSTSTCASTMTVPPLHATPAALLGRARSEPTCRLRCTVVPCASLIKEPPRRTSAAPVAAVLSTTVELATTTDDPPSATMALPSNVAVHAETKELLMCKVAPDSTATPDPTVACEAVIVQWSITTAASTSRLTAPPVYLSHAHHSRACECQRQATQSGSRVVLPRTLANPRKCTKTWWLCFASP